LSGIAHPRQRRNAVPSPPQVQDRRVQRTKGLLHAALAALIHERPYDSIAIKDILYRANVGRSAFYAHFRDKDELLDSGIDRVLRESHPAAPVAATRHEKITAFSLPLFDYIDQCRRGVKASTAASGHVHLHAHLQKVLAESIAKMIERDFGAGRNKVAGLSPDILAQFVASNFVLVLDHWVENGCRLAPRQANDLFRALVLPTLASALG
jgi:AcrR family transcriptional regulator